jgi:hypothetical protein
VLSLAPGCVHFILGNHATIARSTAAGTTEFTILTIDPGVTVQLQTATFRNGDSSVIDPPQGGAIDNGGTLTVSGRAFTGNVAAGRRGIWRRHLYNAGT